MKRKAIVFLWMSISCLLAFTVLSLGYAESEISSADSASVFFSVVDEFRAAIHDPHYDSKFKDSFFSYEWRDYLRLLRKRIHIIRDEERRLTAAPQLW